MKRGAESLMIITRRTNICILMQPPRIFRGCSLRVFAGTFGSNGRRKIEFIIVVVNRVF